MTLEAWVRPATLAGAWRTVLMKEQAGNLVYDLYASRTGSPAAPLSEVYASGSPTSAQATTGLALNTWSHLASTYDGEVVRLYVNGVQVATQAAVGDMPNSTGALRIGGNNIWSEWFDGLIDEVRVYGRVLTGAEIQADMNKAVVNPDAGPPTQPSNLAAIGSFSSVALAWSTSTDDVGVVRYNVHRSTTPGFTPSAANRIAPADGRRFTRQPARGRHLLLQGHRRRRRRQHQRRLQRGQRRRHGDTPPPTAPVGSHRHRLAQLGRPRLEAPTDNVAVVRYNVHRATTNGFTPSAANRIAQPTGTRYTDTGLAAGTYFYRSPPRTPPATSSPHSPGDRHRHRRHHPTHDAPRTLTATPGSGKPRSAGRPPRTTSPSPATTSIARPPTASPRAPRTGSRSPPAPRTPTPASRRHLLLPLTAEDAAGNVSAASAQATAVVSAPARRPRRRLRLRRRHRDPIADQSGTGNNGTLTNGTWSAAGRYGGALSFNGTNTSVTVPDATSLNPTAGMTLEAWVNPTAVQRLAHGHVEGADRQPHVRALREHERQPADRAGVRRRHRPQRERHRAGRRATPGRTSPPPTTAQRPRSSSTAPRPRPWPRPARSRPRPASSTSAATRSGASGSRASSTRSASTTAPSARPRSRPTWRRASEPGHEPADGALGRSRRPVGLSSVALAWGASTDNVGVVRYNVHRSTTAGFTPSAANRIAQPTGPATRTARSRPATYYYRVTAEDAAGNVGAASGRRPRS